MCPMQCRLGSRDCQIHKGVKTWDLFISKFRQTAETMVNYVGCDLNRVGVIEVDAKNAFIQKAQDSAMEWIKRLRILQPGCDTEHS